MLYFFFFKQKTAYEMRISDWSSDVCSSDLRGAQRVEVGCAAVQQDVRLASHDAGGRARDVEQHRVETVAGRFVPPRAGVGGVGRAQVRVSTDAQPREGVAHASEALRSAERRVGKEGVSPCRSRWSRYHKK